MIFTDDVRDWLPKSTSPCCPKCDGYGRQIARWNTGEVIDTDEFNHQIVVFGVLFAKPTIIEICKVIVTRQCFTCDALFWHECDDGLPF